MKRFFPSSVMLTPFVVKHYSQPEQDDTDIEPSDDFDECRESEEKE